MLKRMMILGAAAALLAAIAAPAAADHGGPDDSGVVHRGHYPFGMAFQDSEAGLVALGGPPPELGCIGEGFENAEIMEVATPAGAIKVLIRDTETFYIYEAGSIDEVCEAALSTGIDPIAVAMDSKVVFTDNFVNYEPGHIGNPFGGNANGTAYDEDGNAWNFHGNQKFMLDKDGNFTLISDTVKLNKRGK
jgi:uncharacterized protein YaiE (UPF0345 family)